MDKNKRVMKMVLATALSISVFGTAVAERGNIGSAIWPFTKSHTQEEISSAYEKGFSLIDDGLKLVKDLDDPNEAQGYIMELQGFKSDLDDDDKRTYDKAIDLQKEIKKVYSDIKARINVQEIERRKAEEERAKQIEEQKLKAELEEKQKEAAHRRKLEKQKLQMEKEERERQEAIKNKIVSLEEKLDSILRDASKKIENSENVEHMNVRAAEIREKIQQIDNLNRVSGIEVLFEELQTEITNVLAEEEKIRQEQLRKSLEEAKEGLFELRETLQNLLSDLDEENENYAKFSDMIIGYHPELIDSIDNLEGAEAVKNELESAISKTKVLLEEQAKKEAEKKAKEEQRRKIDEIFKNNKIHGGYEVEKNKLDETIDASKYEAKSILISGPPGIGKNTLVNEIVDKRNIKLVEAIPSKLIGKNGAERLANKFNEAIMYSQTNGKQTILFLDECDYLGHDRGTSGSSNELVLCTMGLLDELHRYKNLTVVALTNRKEDMDPALLRRFDIKIKLGDPNVNDIIKILNIYLNVFNHNIDLNEAATGMIGLSGAEIKESVKTAGMIAKEEKSEIITIEILMRAVALVKENR